MVTWFRIETSTRLVDEVINRKVSWKEERTNYSKQLVFCFNVGLDTEHYD